MPVVLENREAGVVRKGAFYDGFAGLDSEGLRKSERHSRIETPNLALNTYLARWWLRKPASELAFAIAMFDERRMSVSFAIRASSIAWWMVLPEYLAKTA